MIDFPAPFCQAFHWPQGSHGCGAGAGAGHCEGWESSREGGKTEGRRCAGAGLGGALRGVSLRDGRCSHSSSSTSAHLSCLFRPCWCRAGRFEGPGKDPVRPSRGGGPRELGRSLGGAGMGSMAGGDLAGVRNRCSVWGRCGVWLWFGEGTIQRQSGFVQVRLKHCKATGPQISQSLEAFAALGLHECRQGRAAGHAQCRAGRCGAMTSML